MFDAIIIGLVQGLTEFLPVSSSAHVLVVEKLLKFEEDPESFAGTIHLATTLAVLIYFRKDIWRILKSFFKPKEKSLDDDRKLGIQIIIATIPVLAVGYFIEKSEFFEKLSDNLYLISFSLIFFGVLLYLAEKYSFKKNEKKQEITTKDSFIIGASQLVAAALAGASRSGFTLTVSFWRNIDRKVASKFILLISIPVSVLPGIYGLFIEKSVTFNSNFYWSFGAAFISGILAIKLLIELVKKTSLKWFSVYRIVLGIGILVYAIAIV